jgi:putative protease
LCRSLEQVKACLETDVALIYADFEFIKQFPAAVEAARAAGKRIALATPRIHMPGENGYFKNMLKLKPDAILIRNTGAMYYFMKQGFELDAGLEQGKVIGTGAGAGTRAGTGAGTGAETGAGAETGTETGIATENEAGVRTGDTSGNGNRFAAGSGYKPELIGDFSLNAANHKTVELFVAAGCSKVTPSYDLNIQQMVDLLRQTDTSKLEIVIHQHMPMFHTEHCVYCTFLSEGTDYTNCGRPCEEHRVSLQDRIGMSHPVRVDEGCRNTVYNAIDQSGAEYITNFMDLGVPRFRIEFLEESAERVHEVLGLYQQAIHGQISGNQILKRLKATNQLGVTKGQLVR